MRCLREPKTILMLILFTPSYNKNIQISNLFYLPYGRTSNQE